MNKFDYLNEKLVLINNWRLSLNEINDEYVANRQKMPEHEAYEIRRKRADAIHDNYIDNLLKLQTNWDESIKES